MNDINDMLKALDVFKNSSPDFVKKNIFTMSEDQKKEYEILLNNFIKTNSSESSTTEKGKALEKLVSYLLEKSGGIFSIKENLHTTTNEIDQIVEVNDKGNGLIGINLINNYYSNFLCECKNYSNKVGVTYVGKFCNLLLSSKLRLGIFFSYHGVTGTKWKDSSGLIKKFYLSKEKLEERFCVIDFNKENFIEILNGKTLIQIIDDKIKNLQLDTEYQSHLSKHPAEDKLKAIVK